jgi:hypothetical protein
VGAIGTCDLSGALRRCTSVGLTAISCPAGCGLYTSSSCDGTPACIQCSSIPTYCAGAASAPICQGELRIECYDNSYTLDWCPASGKTCHCPQGACACQ